MLAIDKSWNFCSYGNEIWYRRSQLLEWLIRILKRRLGSHVGEEGGMDHADVWRQWPLSPPSHPFPMHGTTLTPILGLLGDFVLASWHAAPSTPPNNCLQQESQVIFVVHLDYTTPLSPRFPSEINRKEDYCRRSHHPPPSRLAVYLCRAMWSFPSHPSPIILLKYFCLPFS